jgi:DNA-binding NarL/FixJ family response regulator
MEVLRLVADGHSNRQVAGNLVISEKTVEHHIEHIFDKLMSHRGPPLSCGACRTA